MQCLLLHNSTCTLTEFKFSYIKVSILCFFNKSQIVFPDCGEIISAGNFHGEYLAKVLDYLAVAVHELASVSERLVNFGELWQRQEMSASFMQNVMFKNNLVKSWRFKFIVMYQSYICQNVH
jgi:hypothetical protein